MKRNEIVSDVKCHWTNIFKIQLCVKVLSLGTKKCHKFFVSLLTTWTKYTGARVLPNIRSWPSTKVPKKTKELHKDLPFLSTLNFEE